MKPHRWLLADPVTDRALGWIPLGGVTYSRRINTPGDLEGTLTINSRAHGELARLLQQRTLALYAFRGDTIWWGGLVWGSHITQPVRSQTAMSRLQGATFESYPEQRRILDSNVLIDPPVDRATAIATVWAHLQSAGPTSTVQVDTTNPGAVGGDPWSGLVTVDTATTYGDLLREITSLEPGIESTIDVWADPDGTRRRRLRVATVLGDPSRAHLVATPGMLVSWGDQADQTTRATHAMARGADAAKNVGGDTVALTSPIQVDTAAVADGVLRVDGVADFDDTDPATLPAKARKLLAPRSPVPPTVTVRLPEGHAWTPGNLGDPGRVVLTGPTWAGGRLDTTARIIGVSVKPAERGQPEEVTFEFQTN